MSSESTNRGTERRPVIFAHLYSAMFVNGYGLPRGKAYIDRTGNIVFVYESEAEAAHWMGRDAAIDAVVDRATVEANQSRWREIPQHDQLERLTDQDKEELMKRFLDEAGLQDAEYV